MIYRHKFKSELADDIWKKFHKKCFSCGTDLPTSRAMQLDHTRPLAYLWPLDETGTALCKTCNSQKRDRMPAAFYVKPGQLDLLAKITGIPLTELLDPVPNEAAIELLLARKEWLFTTFLTRPEMVKERDSCPNTQRADPATRGAWFLYSRLRWALQNAEEYGLIEGILF